MAGDEKLRCSFCDRDEDEVNWLLAPPVDGLRCQVKLRAREAPQPAVVGVAAGGAGGAAFDRCRACADWPRVECAGQAAGPGGFAAGDGDLAAGAGGAAPDGPDQDCRAAGLGDSSD